MVYWKKIVKPTVFYLLLQSCIVIFAPKTTLCQNISFSVFTVNTINADLCFIPIVNIEFQFQFEATGISIVFSKYCWCRSLEKLWVLSSGIQLRTSRIVINLFLLNSYQIIQLLNQVVLKDYFHFTCAVQLCIISKSSTCIELCITHNILHCETYRYLQQDFLCFFVWQTDSL